MPQPPPSLPSLAARYLQARTHLLCGRWGDASRELQALLPLLPQLRASMHALGLSGEALLAQTALAMLRNPKDEKEALLRLFAELKLDPAEKVAYRLMAPHPLGQALLEQCKSYTPKGPYALVEEMTAQAGQGLKM